MLTIENLSTTNSSDKTRVLAHAQTVSNFFVEAIDQNDCNVKVVIGFYQELDDTINSILDLDKAFNPTPLEWYKTPLRDPSPLEDYTYVEEPLISDYITEAAIKALKDRCINCSLKLPRVNFHNDLNFLFEKLSLQLDVFRNVFEKPSRDNFCHLAYGLQKTCIPDLIKMIAMLLTAYAAIMALRKFPSFSLNVFIKGVISALLAQIVGSINISLDMSSTGLPCLLSVLEELASKVPTNESLYTGLTEEQRVDSWIKDYVPLTIYEKNLQERVESGEITAEFAAIKLDRYTKANDPVRYYTKALEDQLGAEEAEVSQIFGFVNSIVESAQGDINSYIDSILGVINFFECEGKRSGSDFTEILEYINDLNKVINMLSSLVGVFLKKALNLDLCKDERSIKDIEEILQNAEIEPLTPEDIKDILEDYNELESQLADDGLSVLIYDKPKKSSIPKLTLLGCNFKEFAEAHRLDNLIKTTIADFLNKDSKEDETLGFGNLNWKDFSDVVFPNRNNYAKNEKEYTDFEDKYSKYLKPVNPIDKNFSNNNFNSNLISSIKKPLRDKDINNIRDVIKNYFSGNINNYINITNNYINNNFIFNEYYYNFINKNDSIKDFTGNVIDKIEVISTPIEETLEGFTDSLDELLDFIYNNPFKDDKDLESISGIVVEDSNISLSSVFKSNNEELKEQQSKFIPSTSECRSIEDVMAVLNNIKI